MYVRVYMPCGSGCDDFDFAKRVESRFEEPKAELVGKQTRSCVAREVLESLKEGLKCYGRREFAFVDVNVDRYEVQVRGLLLLF